MFIICYEDNTGRSCYDELAIDPKNIVKMEETLAEWKKKHPDRTVTYLFDSDNTFTRLQWDYGRDHFELYARRFDMDPCDYGRKLNKGQIIIGIKESNRKYPIILYDPVTETIRKASVNYVRQNMT